MVSTQFLFTAVMASAITVSTSDIGFNCGKYTNSLSWCQNSPLASLCVDSCSGGSENHDACSTNRGCRAAKVSHGCSNAEVHGLCPSVCNSCGRGIIPADDLKGFCRVTNGTLDERCGNCPAGSTTCSREVGGAVTYLGPHKCTLSWKGCQLLNNTASFCSARRILMDTRRCPVCSAYKEKYLGIKSCECKTADDKPPTLHPEMHCSGKPNVTYGQLKKIGDGVWDSDHKMSPPVLGSVCVTSQGLMVVSKRDLERRFSTCFENSDAGWLTFWKMAALRNATCSKKVVLSSTCSQRIIKLESFRWTTKCPVELLNGQTLPLRTASCQNTDVLHMSLVDVGEAGSWEKEERRCMPILPGETGPTIVDQQLFTIWKYEKPFIVMNETWDTFIELENADYTPVEMASTLCEGFIGKVRAACFKRLHLNLERAGVTGMDVRSKRASQNAASWLANAGANIACFFQTGSATHPVYDSSSPLTTEVTCESGEAQAIRDLKKSVDYLIGAAKGVNKVDALQEKELAEHTENFGRVESLIRRLNNASGRMAQDVVGLHTDFLSLNNGLFTFKTRLDGMAHVLQEHIETLYEGVENLTISYIKDKVDALLNSFVTSREAYKERLHTLAGIIKSGKPAYGLPLSVAGLTSGSNCWITEIPISSRVLVGISCLKKYKTWRVYRPEGLPSGQCGAVWEPKPQGRLLIRGEEISNGTMCFTSRRTIQESLPDYSWTEPISVVGNTAKTTLKKAEGPGFVLVSPRTMWTGVPASITTRLDSGLSQKGNLSGPTLIKMACNSSVTLSACGTAFNWKRACARWREEESGFTLTSIEVDPIDLPDPNVTESSWVPINYTKGDADELLLEIERTDNESAISQKKVYAIEPKIKEALDNATKWANKSIEDLAVRTYGWGIGLAVAIAMIAFCLVLWRCCCAGEVASATAFVLDGDLVARTGESCADWSDYMFLVISCITAVLCIHFLLDAFRKCSKRRRAQGTPAQPVNLPRDLALATISGNLGASAKPIKVLLELSTEGCSAFARDILAGTRGLGILTSGMAIAIFILRRVGSRGDDMLVEGGGFHIGVIIYLAALSIQSPKTAVVIALAVLKQKVAPASAAASLTEYEHEATVWFVVGWTFIGLTVVVTACFILDYTRGMPAVITASKARKLSTPFKKGNILLWRTTGEPCMHYIGKIGDVPETVTPFCTKSGRWSLFESVVSAKAEVIPAEKSGQMMCITNGLRRKIIIWDVPEVKTGKATGTVRQIYTQRQAEGEVNEALSVMEEMPEPTARPRPAPRADGEAEFFKFVRAKNPAYKNLPDSVLKQLKNVAKMKELAEDWKGSRASGRN